MPDAKLAAKPDPRRDALPVPMLVKVCGITRAQDAQALQGLGVSGQGVDLLGFIFAGKSPRLVTPKFVAGLPPGPARRVGVFVEQTPDQVSQIMDAARLDFAQLHGAQDPEFCRQVGPERVITVFWPQRHATLAELEAEMARYADACAMMLLDAGASGGGHGRSLDFPALRGLHAPRPWLLAGGIGPDNAAQALEAAPAGLDLNSGVETSPGVKDADKVRQVLTAITR